MKGVRKQGMSYVKMPVSAYIPASLPQEKAAKTNGFCGKDPSI